mmetsp:Transcript_13567/g.26164  ORF Transcript_13567/g.26164 Transcript_13567/m.26164 type:complete len:85 (+) Transcript_13567:768-1022(+)
MWLMLRLWRIQQAHDSGDCELGWAMRSLLCLLRRPRLLRGISRAEDDRRSREFAEQLKRQSAANFCGWFVETKETRTVSFLTGP